MVEHRTRLLGGVSVADTAMITDAAEYAQKLSEPYLFNHAMRSWLFATRIGQLRGIDCDQEVVAVGTILHDIGLTAGVSGQNRFEVNGADAARSFITERGFSDHRSQLIWDLVALNSTPSIALHKEPEVALGTMGIGLDWGGFGIESIPAAEIAEIVAAFPRLGDENKFGRDSPSSRHDDSRRANIKSPSRFRKRFVPPLADASTVDRRRTPAGGVSSSPGV